MYYQQTPISEKPEMQTGIGITEAFGIMESGRKVATAFYHGEGKWTHAIKFWLKPITGVVMTEEQLKEMWVAAINYENDKRLGRLLNNSIDFTEYIKRFKL